jgi:formylglycine-generating enzyme required for sulfatase activity
VTPTRNAPGSETPADMAVIDVETGGATPVKAFPEGRSPCGCYDMCGNTSQSENDLVPYFAGSAHRAHLRGSMALRAVQNHARLGEPCRITHGSESHAESRTARRAMLLWLRAEKGVRSLFLF